MILLLALFCAISINNVNCDLFSSMDQIAKLMETGPKIIEDLTALLDYQNQKIKIAKE